MKTPLIEKLDMPYLVHAASSLALNGTLAISGNRLVYLDIDDAYIHRLFPMLQDKEIVKPNYFGRGSVGAHITVAYPEESKKINKSDLGAKHGFVIHDIVAATIGLKIYYVLLVASPSLLQVRRKYELTDLLCFKGYAIGFHITIGVKA